MYKMLKRGIACILSFLFAMFSVLLVLPESINAGDVWHIDLSAIDDSWLSNQNGISFLNITAPDKSVIITGDNICTDYVLNINAENCVIQLSGQNKFSGLIAKCRMQISGGEIVFQNTFGNPIWVEGNSLIIGTDTYITAMGQSEALVIMNGSLEMNGGNIKIFSTANSAVAMDAVSYINLVSGKMTLSGAAGAVRGGIVNTIAGTKTIGSWNTDVNVFALTPDQDVVVVLDPGHGGSEYGTQIAAQNFPEESGLYQYFLEKNLNLIIGLAAYHELNQYQGIKVYLTRSSDENMTLYTRAKVAASYHPDVLISLHLNSVYDINQINVATGAEVWKSLIPRYQRDGLNQWVLLGMYTQGLDISRGIKVRPDYEPEIDGDKANYWDDANNIGTEAFTGMYSDYYSIIENSAERYVPALIIEHLHLSNVLDVQKVSTDAATQLLGIKDAQAVAAYYGLLRKH